MNLHVCLGLTLPVAAPSWFFGPTFSIWYHGVSPAARPQILAPFLAPKTKVSTAVMLHQGCRCRGPTPRTNAQARKCTRLTQVSSNRANHVSRMPRKLNCHGSYLGARSKQSSKANSVSMTGPAPHHPRKTWENRTHAIPCKLQEPPSAGSYL